MLGDIACTGEVLVREGWPTPDLACDCENIRVQASHIKFYHPEYFCAKWKIFHYLEHVKFFVP